MSIVKPIAYIPSSFSGNSIAFERFLPIFSHGVISSWLEKNISRQDWLLDPLGATPELAIEAAENGYRILVACNNPVIAFQLRMLASIPAREDFFSVISELAEQRKGSDLLQVSIENLYLTRCASCGREIQASAFLWRKGEITPFARQYRCPHCNDEGEHPVTDEDIFHLQPIQRVEKLHRSRALERIMAANREDRENVEEFLRVYPPRALYILFTLINKIEGMSLSPKRRELLEAVVLSVMDSANSIWPWPEARERPRQLSTPGTFIEKNLWMVLERTPDQWVRSGRPVRITIWPEVPQEAGICLYPGRLRDLVLNPIPIKINSILCVFPRPNQAFWTLCSLWSSWLWGQDKAGKISSVFDRRRFDWHWHTNALHSVLTPASTLTGPNVKVFGILPEPAVGLVNAVIESAAICGMDLTGCAVKNISENIQMEWRTGTVNREFKPVNIQKTAREAIRDLLHEVGEPTEHIEVHTAAMCALAAQNAFPPSIQHLTYEKAGEIQATLTSLINEAGFLRRMDATAQDPESGLWWLAQSESCQTPLADRLETEMISWLQAERSIPHHELLVRVNARFPGYLTPPDALTRHILESYADFDTTSQIWTIKESELDNLRSLDIQETRDQIRSLGIMFGLEVEGDFPINWYIGKTKRNLLYRFFPTAQAVVNRETGFEIPDECENVIILPGSRAGLLKYKLLRDPFLREQVSSHWHFLKYRTLRGIYNRTDLTLELWKVLIDSDPISLDETTQLSVFQ